MPLSRRTLGKLLGIGAIAKAGKLFWPNDSQAAENSSEAPHSVMGSVTETPQKQSHSEPLHGCQLSGIRGAKLKKADVFIAGTGPAGSTFARHLVLGGKKVLMADMGPTYTARPGQNLKNSFIYQRNLNNFGQIIGGLLHPISVPTPPATSQSIDPTAFRPGKTVLGPQNPRQERSLNLDSAAAAYAVGGMLLHWTCSVPRHHKMERISFISDQEWETLYSEAETILNKSSSVYDKSIRNTVIKEHLNSHLGQKLTSPVQNLPMAVRRVNPDFVYYTGVDDILAPIIDEPSKFGEEHFCIMPGTRVAALETCGERVQYAIVEDPITGEQCKVEADIFIVACGTVMSAQLLWKSNIRNDEDGPLGKYLIDHPIAFAQVVLSKEVMKKMTDDPRFSKEKRKDIDPVKIPRNDPPPNLWIPVQEGREWHCQIHKDAFHYGPVPADIDDRTVIDLRWFGSMEPRIENRVKFESDLVNEFGMPQPTYKFAYSDADSKLMHKMMTDLLEVSQLLGGFLPGAEPRFMPSGLCLHTQGTCRMGTNDDGKSVVDPYCRVWGYKNLFVGGNSVIPTANAANPTLTTVALATRAAWSILGKS